MVLQTCLLRSGHDSFKQFLLTIGGAISKLGYEAAQLATECTRAISATAFSAVLRNLMPGLIIWFLEYCVCCKRETLLFLLLTLDNLKVTTVAFMAYHRSKNTDGALDFDDCEQIAHAVVANLR